MTKVREACFCAFCKNERKVFRKKTLSFSGYLASGILAGLLSLVFWQGIDPRAIVFFVMGIILTEVTVHIRWRLGMSCPYCGFDPILYKRSPNAACEKVKDFMVTRKRDPMFYLSSNGYEKLAKMKRSKEQIEALALANNPVALKPDSLDQSLPSKDYAGIEQGVEDVLNMPPV